MWVICFILCNINYQTDEWGIYTFFRKLYIEYTALNKHSVKGGQPAGDGDSQGSFPVDSRKPLFHTHTHTHTKLADQLAS